MRRPLDAAAPARYILLALLLDGPRHGYALMRDVDPAMPLGKVIHLASSHLYAQLIRLEHDGLVHKKNEDGGPRPARHVFTLTEQGRETVLRWAEETVAKPRDMHIDFPLKLYVSWKLDPAQATALVARQRAVFTTYIERLERSISTASRSSAPSSSTALFSALVDDARLERARAAVLWLDHCRQTLTAAPAAWVEETMS